jgi:hypothetical protein
MTNQIFKKKPQTVWININPNVTAQGYVTVGNLFNTINQSSCFLGSGIVSCKKGVKYPIYNPLILNDENHFNILNYANCLILQLVDEYLESNLYNSTCQKILDQVHRLLCLALTIDGFETIPKDVILEAINNFCLDYNTMSIGTLLRQPLNYIFDILSIDGIYSKDYSISYIQIDYEGIEYY